MWDRGNGVLFSDQEELNLVIHRKRIDETRVVQHSQDKSNIRRQKSILSPHPGLAGLEVRERRGGKERIHSVGSLCTYRRTTTKLVCMI